MIFYEKVRAALMSGLTNNQDNNVLDGIQKKNIALKAMKIQLTLLQDDIDAKISDTILLHSQSITHYPALKLSKWQEIAKEDSYFDSQYIRELLET